jgi:hypothetical protein
MILNGMDAFNPGEGSWGHYAKQAYKFGGFADTIKQMNQEEAEMAKHHARLHEYKLMSEMAQAKAKGHEYRNEKIEREAKQLYDLQREEEDKATKQIIALAEAVQKKTMTQEQAAMKVARIFGTVAKWGLKIGGVLAGAATTVVGSVASTGAGTVPAAVAGTKLGMALSIIGDGIGESAPHIGKAVAAWFNAQGKEEQERIKNNAIASADIMQRKTLAEFEREVKAARKKRQAERAQKAKA